MNEKWFVLSVEQIESKLKTNAASGLSPKAARSRANMHKKDSPFFSVKKKRIDRMLLEIFSDIFLVLLTLLAAASLFFEGDLVIGSAILLCVALSVGINLFVYYRDSRTMESMSDFFAPTARVIRGGKLYIVDYRDLVVGDVIMIEKGDIIGCDARLVHSDGLRVQMKVDKKTEKTLEKYAGAIVREDEFYAENMTDMVHAGSSVLSGSGRAIVVAVGKYTYLGAMTGGITEIPSSELPQGLARLKKECSVIGMIMLLLTLPFCIFAVLFGSFPGGNVLLSEAVLMSLAIGASTMLTRHSNLFLTFYVRFIRKSAVSKNPCIIRSVDTLDSLANVDHLFLLDGSIATDGILHFESLISADGETKNPERAGQSATALCEMIALYARARSSAPSIGVRANNELDVAIAEFMSKKAVDAEALKIRCTIHSYLSATDASKSDIISYSDRGVKCEMCVSPDSSAIRECSLVMVAGAEKPISADGRDALVNSFNGYVAMGRRPVVFTRDSGSGRCFIGMMVLHEHTDSSLAKAVSSLRKSGINIISFSNCKGRDGSPEIPDLLRHGNRAYADEFKRQGRDITYNFGSFDEYCGFDADDISTLAGYVKQKGKGLAICAFTDYASEAIAKADVFISCAPVRTGVFGHFDEEIRALEVPGEHGSASCTQTVKAEADVLLMRPKDSKGGLEPLAFAALQCRIAYRNLYGFLKYFVFSQIAKLIAVVFPMLFGQNVADARHVLLLGLLGDIFAMFIFATDQRRGRIPRRPEASPLASFKLKTLLRKEKHLLVSIAAASVLVLLLPRLIALISVFDNYLYKAEYTVCSLVLVQICLWWSVYTEDLLDFSPLARVAKTPAFISWMISCVSFLTLCFLTPVGKLFGLVKNPPIYFIISLLPALSFLVCYFVLTFPKAKKPKMKEKL